MPSTSVWPTFGITSVTGNCGSCTAIAGRPRSRFARIVQSAFSKGITIVMENETPRILIVRLSAIGDTVLSRAGAVCAPRSISKSDNRLDCRADQCAAFARARGFGSSDRSAARLVKIAAARLANRRTMRKFNFEISLDLQGLTKSSLIAWLSGRVAVWDLRSRNSKVAS